MLPIQGCVFCCCASLLLILIIVLWATTKESEGCGIPLYVWFYVFFSVLLISQTLNFIIICCGSESWQTQNIVLSIITFTFLFIWIIYGWVIAMSKDGDKCGDKGDTKCWYIFLLVILILFTLLFAILLCLLLCVCCCLCFLSADQPDNRLRRGQINQVISALNRVPYNENEHENDCAICMCPFDKDSEIT